MNYSCQLYNSDHEFDAEIGRDCRCQDETWQGSRVRLPYSRTFEIQSSGPIMCVINTVQ